MASDPFMRRVRIRNFKSIGSCDVQLGSFSVLVGRNGAGKSNFVDALRFVVDSLQTSPGRAVASRGEIDFVLRRAAGHPRLVGIELRFGVGDHCTADYGFEVLARPKGGYVVKKESLFVRDTASSEVLASYTVDSAQVSSSRKNMPPATNDRLYLAVASGLPEFRAAYDSLLSMGFYNLNPAVMKGVRSRDSGDLLLRDGANIASVVSRLKAEHPKAHDRLLAYLSRIVPGIRGVDRAELGPKETLEFLQEMEGATHPWRFYADSMSDGTLRALGALVAVGQIGSSSQRVSLVGIEEPETALHPAAAGALMGALSEASEETQVLVTSHSPDLIDEMDVSEQSLLVVVSRQGTTRIAAADAASREAIKKHLFTAGELLRMDQLQPDEDDLKRQGQLSFFSSPEF